MKAGQDMKRAGFLVIWLLFIILCIGGRNETEAATLVKEGTIHDSLDPMGFTDIEFKAPVSGFAVLHFDLQLVDLVIRRFEYGGVVRRLVL